MSNIGGLEVLMVLVVALIVLGPTKLPEAARQVGKVVSEVRRVSGGFQRELREAIQDPIIEAEARARGAADGAKKAVDDAKKAVTEPFLTGSSNSTSSKEEPTSPSSPSDQSIDTSPSVDADSADD